MVYSVPRVSTLGVPTPRVSVYPGCLCTLGTSYPTLYPHHPTPPHLNLPQHTLYHINPPHHTPTHSNPHVPTSYHTHPPPPTPTYLYPHCTTRTHLHPPVPTRTYLYHTVPHHHTRTHRVHPHPPLYCTTQGLSQPGSYPPTGRVVPTHGSLNTHWVVSTHPRGVTPLTGPPPPGARHPANFLVIYQVLSNFLTLLLILLFFGPDFKEFTHEDTSRLRVLLRLLYFVPRSWYSTTHGNWSPTLSCYHRPIDCR